MEGCVPEILFILSHFPGTAIQCQASAWTAPLPIKWGRFEGGHSGPSSYGEIAHLVAHTFRSRDVPSEKNNPLPLSRPAQPSPPPGACKQSSVGTESLGQESAFSSIAQTTPSPRRQTFCHTLAACVLRSDTRFRRFFAHPPDNFRFFLASFSRDQSYFNFFISFRDRDCGSQGPCRRRQRIRD